jgi:hypothetical protein
MVLKFFFQYDVVESVKKCLLDDRPSSFQSCVTWARLLWEENFVNTIKQLLFNFSPDSVSVKHFLGAPGDFFPKPINLFES